MNTTQKRRAHEGQRGNRNHGFFAPAFGNIINEILNSPLNEVVTDKPKKYTYPLANVISQDGTFILSLAIPGVAKADVSINIEKNKLTIKSEVENNTDTKYRLREFNYAKFERAFTLSDDVDTDNISAKFDNGVLTISIPTVEEAGPKKVEIV
jgi:HSP20 family protein